MPKNAARGETVIHLTVSGSRWQSPTKCEVLGDSTCIGTLALASLLYGARVERE